MRKINPGKEEKKTEGSIWAGESQTLGVYFHNYPLVCGSVVISRIFALVYFLVWVFYY